MTVVKNQHRGLKWLLLVAMGLILLMVSCLGFNGLNGYQHKQYQRQQSPQQQNHQQKSQPHEKNKQLNKQPQIIEAQALKSEIVKAEDYQQFWIWTPPKNAKKLSQAQTIYLLQGEIRSPLILQQHHRINKNANKNVQLATLTPQGLGVRQLMGKKIWLVYRATSQNWSPTVMKRLNARLAQWQQAGNQVVGIQIDYDAPTYQLDVYATMLEEIRQQLPQHYQLSVTGLLDWANQADDPQFIKLSQTVDELVMQTYQGKTTLPNYSQYLKKLAYVPVDFKVGIIEGGQWQGATFLEDNPHFKGYVVFLR